MKKYALDERVEELPPMSILRVWHERTIGLRVKRTIIEGKIDDIESGNLVKKSRLLTLIHLN